MGRDRAYHAELYRGGRLETAAMWADGHPTDPQRRRSANSLDACVTAHEIELAAEQEHLNTTISSNRRLRILVSVATVIAVIAAIAGVFALQQRSRADEEAATAQRQALETEAARPVTDLQRMRSDTLLLAEQARATIEPDAALALLLAVEVDQLDPTPESSDALHRGTHCRGGQLRPALRRQREPARDDPADPTGPGIVAGGSRCSAVHGRVDGGQTILTSVEAPSGTSTVVRHERARDVLGYIRHRHRSRRH